MKLHVLDTSFSPAQPILPRTGDANLDGFPDLLLITEGRVRLLSAPCTRGVPGCAAQGVRRGWREMVKGVEPLAGITGARIAVFVELDEDGTLDVMVQRTGEQGAGRVLFLQSNFLLRRLFHESHSYAELSIYISLLSVSSDLLLASDGCSSERRV
jgi:integrin alpha FG-GAP repeat containing protein 1